MGAETMVSDLAVGWAQAMVDVVRQANVDNWTAAEASAALFACEHLRELLAMARRSVEERLALGVDARAFTAQHEGAVGSLQAVATNAQRAVDSWPRRPDLEPFLCSYRGFIEDVRHLHRFLAEALAQANRPSAMDWQRVKDAEAAYARGETRPFQRATGG